jgi:hypothetical protein
MRGLKPYDRPVEDWKKELFDDTDASLTSTRGGIAETGTLIIWPDASEPRLMSLVPPIHFALLDAGQLYDTLFAAMTEQGWSERSADQRAARLGSVEDRRHPGDAGLRRAWPEGVDRPVAAGRRGGTAMNATATKFVPGQRIQAARRGGGRRRASAPQLSRRDGFPDHQARRAVPRRRLLERQRALAEHIRKYSLARLPDCSNNSSAS